MVPLAAPTNDSLISTGRSDPLGATVYKDGVNFSVFSKNSVYMELLLFRDADDIHPRVISLNPYVNRTFYYWHVFVRGIGAGQLYGYRVYGPADASEGHRFDGQKVLIDPYARAVAYGKHFDRQAAMRPGDNLAHCIKSVVVDMGKYEWGDDRPIGRPYSQSVIYEMHVGGFTRNPNSKVPKKKRGTYAGLIEKIPYLKELGITAVELLPVQQFDEQDAPAPLKNYWGYSPLAFFAPHLGYSSDQSPLGAVNEFRDMVKALHAAGIEVILDVVFNHTAESDEHGPVYSFKGFENRAYYILKEDKALYANYSGCGNTINANHSITRRIILDCLRYWVTEMHVDGFRFDLAAILSRDESGQPLKNPPVLWSMESDPVLAGTKLIAEAWDAAGLYQVGSFIGHKFAEWNGQYRDDVRRFMKGDPGTVTRMAYRLAGSRDLYPHPSREPNRSINFITSHDGFTLNDLVSYNRKHNQKNLEGNRDGHNANFSWNHGVEGPTSKAAVEQLRLRQIKNFLTVLLISQGAPMLLMGDEVRRSQKGNNNAYCQDNATSWFDWKQTETQADLLRFVRGLIDFTQQTAPFNQEYFWADEVNGASQLTWHGVRLNRPDWSYESHSLAFTLTEPGEQGQLHIMINAYWEPLVFELPPLLARHRWRRIVDTSLAPPDDFTPREVSVRVDRDRYRLEPRSVVVLWHNGPASPSGGRSGGGRRQV